MRLAVAAAPLLHCGDHADGTDEGDAPELPVVHEAAAARM